MVTYSHPAFPAIPHAIAAEHDDGTVTMRNLATGTTVDVVRTELAAVWTIQGGDDTPW